MNKLVLIFLSIIILYGDGIDEKIKMLVDKNSYKRHQKLIEILFRNRTSFYKDGLVDNVKIVKILKKNGLLKIFYKKPRTIETTFITSIKPELFIKSITDVLRDMGYSYYITAKMQKSNHKLNWKISYNSDHVIDPVLFAKKLTGYNMDITDISKTSSEWIYNIASLGVVFADAQKIELTEKKYTILDPTGEYWINIETVGRSIKILKKASGYWYPKIIFFDKDLKILKLYKNDKFRKRVVISIPTETKFIKIADRYGVDSLKKGITVEVTEKR